MACLSGCYASWGLTFIACWSRSVINPPALPPRTHRLLLVELEGEKWIADVGFGGRTLTAAGRLMPDIMPNHATRRVSSLLQGVMIRLLQFNHHQHWQSMYRFDLCEQQQSDYVIGNFWVGALA